MGGSYYKEVETKMHWWGQYGWGMGFGWIAMLIFRHIIS
jgi:hypothetical protein